MPRIYLETFGCQMNELDSELVSGQLRAAGHSFTDRWTEADVVLYNTCSVREVAENKAWSRIGKVGLHKKQHNPDLVLGVIGCMAERDGRDITAKHPQVDLVCGPADLDKVPMLIDGVLRDREARYAIREYGRKPRPAGEPTSRGGTGRAEVGEPAEDPLERVDLARPAAPQSVTSAGSPASAYVRITRGCNKKCTYCVVPNTRGPEVHRPPAHILGECRKLVDSGVREITLLGQTVNHYHYDDAIRVTVGGIDQPQVGATISPNAGNGGPLPTFNATTTSFAGLLAMIHDELPSLRRLRFVTSLPRDFGDDILRVIADRPRICRYLHLPVQSGSDRILKLMNRGYRVADYDDLLRRVRHFLPDAELATDIITGFPTETEEDHRKTVDLIRRAGFKNSFIFKYSPRPGTVAIDRFADDVPLEVKKRRNAELLAAQAEASAAVHARYVGRTLQVQVEGVSRRTRKQRNAAAPGSAGVQLAWEAPEETVQLSGRTDTDLIVMFDGPEDLAGQTVDVAIGRSAPLALFGRLVGTPILN